MKCAFIIDKTQTLQIIVKTLKQSVLRGHECTLFCCFDKGDLGLVYEYLHDVIEKIKWVNNTNRNNLIDHLKNNRNLYDCVIGINFFNQSLRPIFENNEITNYSFEYCWNEIYNQRSSFKSNGTLFCNSPRTKKIINSLSDYPNLLHIGSPWFEYLSEQKTDKKLKKIVFMAPHNSFYSKANNLSPFVKKLLNSLRAFCNKNEYKLVLKTRSKYVNSEKNHTRFDEVVSDKIASSHINVYKDASLVINFCSSAINELTYLEVPYLVIGPEIQKDLHTNLSCDAGIKKIHEYFYSGAIIDKTHCDSYSLSKKFNKEHLENKLINLINSDKDWKSFQKLHFAGDVKGSSIRVMEHIENEVFRKNTNNK